MKRWISLLLVFSLLLLPACKKVSKEWTEQFELGSKYLTDGNYEEAILAYTAAIEIDPNQPDAFVGRGDAYIARVTHLAKDGIKLRTEQSRQIIDALQHAEQDYQTASNLAAEGCKMTTDPEILAAKLAQTTERLAQIEEAEAAASMPESAETPEQAEEAASPRSLEYEMREEVIEFHVSGNVLYYSNTINYPYFLGSSPVETTLNQYYAEAIAEFRNTNRDFEAEYREAVQNHYMHTDGLFDNLFAEVTYNQNGAVSIRDVYTMWSGGAHPYQGHTGLTYDIATGAELTLRDILIGSDAQILDAITSTPAYSEVAMMYSDPSFMFDVPWILNEEGLCFLLEVGAALPRLEIVIPYTSSDTYVIDLTGGQTASTVQTGNTYGEVVTTVFEDRIIYGAGPYSYQDPFCIPQIQMDSPEIQELNEAIYDKLYGYYNDAMADLNMPAYGLTTYLWTVHGDILSLAISVLVTPMVSPETELLVYNVNLRDGTVLTTEEFLSQIGMDPDTYRDTMRTSYESLWMLRCGESGSFQMLDETLEDSNLDASIPFLNEDGSLCTACTFYVPAGNGTWNLLVDLDAADEFFLTNVNEVQTVRP